VTDRQPIRRALVSVFDKAGLDQLAGALGTAGVEVVSTGSTAQALEGHGLAVTRVETVTGFPELLDGRVKTLHPKVHAGLLADRRRPEHAAQLRQAGIAPFDLVVCNLYPFEETVADPGAGEDLAVERIDVGGPAMVRAAAKNYASVAVVCDPADYGLVEAALAAGGTTLAERRTLAARAFARTAAYDGAVAAWFTREQAFPATLPLAARLVQALRYGENPHQAAAFYALDGPAGGGPLRSSRPGHPGPQAAQDPGSRATQDPAPVPPPLPAGRRGRGLAGAVQVAGKQLSYNNLLDADAALGLVAEYADRPFAVVVKHTNPCGAAPGETLEAAYAAALEGDPVSAYGGVVGLSRPLDGPTAQRLAGVFTELVVAPGFDAAAREVLAGKPSLRLLEVELAEGAEASEARPLTLRSVAGGLLAQQADVAPDDPAAWTVAAGAPPPAATLEELALAQTVAKHVKSNAIVLVNQGRVVGVGAGQMSRVDSVRIAVAKAGAWAAGAVAGSDAFFPFPDGVEELAAAGVRAVVQPGGSVRDAEVTAAADRAGLTLLLTGRRHFRH
jgi:phosphoribosylaminoimidazolecarboxamide formyltransferase/IMP cyclohydrolase